MKLQHQLLCVSLLLLSLPWAGCQYIREMDATLAFAQEQVMTATSQAIASALAEESSVIYPFFHRYTNNGNPDEQLYFEPINYPITIDGYDDEWQTGTKKSLNKLNTTINKVTYRTAIKNEQLFLFFHINDPHIQYNNPTLNQPDNGDRLILAIGAQDHYIINTSAPGKVTPFSLSTTSQQLTPQPLIKAYWQDTGTGYTIELSLPLSLTSGRMGFYIIDENNTGQDTEISHYQTPTGKLNSAPPWLVYQSSELRKKLAIFKQPGMRLGVVDKYLWQLSTQGTLEQDHSDQGNWLLRKLYRYILGAKYDNYPIFFTSSRYDQRQEVLISQDKKISSIWYADPHHHYRSILATAAPVIVNNEVIATVIIEQNSDRFLALTGEAFNHLFFFSFSALGLTGLGLLAYASWLSWRIRRLSHAANNIVNANGQKLSIKLNDLEQHFPQSHSHDEIGDLNRNYMQLLSRLREYTNYLQTLSRKLSHELRTPLAIVHSSLDNLDNSLLDNDSRIYQQRAKEGTLRLGGILTAMSEASRVEESILSAESEPINLYHLLRNITEAYSDIYNEHTIHFHSYPTHPRETPTLIAVPELLVQMMDKLINNATDFCPQNGHIDIVYREEPGTLLIDISNDGPLLPNAMQDQLFDNMVSLRPNSHNKIHLGLGLYIVQLIISHHDGHISAENRPDRSGVIFKIRLPAL